MTMPHHKSNQVITVIMVPSRINFVMYVKIGWFLLSPCVR